MVCGLGFRVCGLWFVVCGLGLAVFHLSDDDDVAKQVRLEQTCDA